MKDWKIEWPSRFAIVMNNRDYSDGETITICVCKSKAVAEGLTNHLNKLQKECDKIYREDYCYESLQAAKKKFEDNCVLSFVEFNDSRFTEYSVVEVPSID